MRLLAVAFVCPSRLFQEGGVEGLQQLHGWTLQVLATLIFVLKQQKPLNCGCIVSPTCCSMRASQHESSVKEAQLPHILTVQATPRVDGFPATPHLGLRLCLSQSSEQFNTVVPIKGEMWL
ncbi:hypothetical protein TcWFU_000264 [Taenia crassiceps]|uniref:Secreted protein n=1 Tax=Taenia crassiceps TaxID=6207 RepID=A0ABR4Q0Z4_9CEST